MTFGYQYSRVWTTAVRLMRVDFEANITEKDKEDGYFLFEYRERGKTYPGSVELVSISEGDNETVRVVLTIQALPSYVENMMVDRLARKLEQEFGPPRAAKRPGSDPNAKPGPERDDADPPESGRVKPAPKGKSGADKAPNRSDPD